jgi:hypothetical protein
MQDSRQARAPCRERVRGSVLGLILGVCHQYGTRRSCFGVQIAEDRQQRRGTPANPLGGKRPRFSLSELVKQRKGVLKAGSRLKLRELGAKRSELDDNLLISYLQRADDVRNVLENVLDQGRDDRI